MISTETPAQAWRQRAAHMRHEEEAALPLVERRIGAAGWSAIGKQVHRAQGEIRAGARYLPWVLDGAQEQTRTAVLSILPSPARAQCRRVWEPKYCRSVHLG
ncbi:MAG TPA: hypothetical protein VNB91_09575 [Jatrophihabitantaceae bacterium]|nr:hypothetical protein [Jatrophihabitantaceae bacterium]